MILVPLLLTIFTAGCLATPSAAAPVDFSTDNYNPASVAINLSDGLTCDDNVELTFKGRSTLDVADSPCGAGTNRKRIAKRTTVDIEWGSEHNESLPSIWAHVSSTIRHKPSRVQIRFTIRLNGERIQRGTITTTYRPIPLRRINEGSDAFVNICINEAKKITSKDGVLGCYVGGYTIVATRVISNGRVRDSSEGHEY